MCLLLYISGPAICNPIDCNAFLHLCHYWHAGMKAMFFIGGCINCCGDGDVELCSR